MTWTTERRRAVALVVAAVALLGAVLLASCVGAVSLPSGGVLATLLDAAHLGAVPAALGLDPGQALPPTDRAILLVVRLPRVLMAGLVGGTLAMAGAGYQGVFRNPLADPYLLGAAAGAGLGATLVIATSQNAAVRGAAAGGINVPLAAFVGALGGVTLAYLVGSAAQRGGAGGMNLLLAGIAVASFLTAIQTLVQQLHAESLREVYSWILGQLDGANADQIRLTLPFVVVTAVVLIACGRMLDVLSVGDDEAGALGARPRLIRFAVLLAASLGTAAAVSASGLIGFVGLVVPHIVRRLAGSSYRVILPVSLLGGAAFLILADMVARTVVAPAEIPIGVVTAFVGAPFFALLLLRRGPAS